MHILAFTNSHTGHMPQTLFMLWMSLRETSQKMRSPTVSSFVYCISFSSQRAPTNAPSSFNGWHFSPGRWCWAIRPFLCHAGNRNASRSTFLCRGTFLSRRIGPVDSTGQVGCTHLCFRKNSDSTPSSLGFGWFLMDLRWFATIQSCSLWGTWATQWLSWFYATINHQPPQKNLFLFSLVHLPFIFDHILYNPCFFCAKNKSQSKNPSRWKKVTCWAPFPVGSFFEPPSFQESGEGSEGCLPQTRRNNFCCRFLFFHGR